MVSWNPSQDPHRPPTGEAPATANNFRSAEAGGTSFLPPRLQSKAASQQPHASTVRMSVNNCHMLHYRLNKGKVDPPPAPKADLELVTIPTAVVAAPSPRHKTGMLKKQLTYLSVKVPTNNKVQPALVTVTPGKHNVVSSCCLSSLLNKNSQGFQCWVPTRCVLT